MLSDFTWAPGAMHTHGVPFVLVLVFLAMLGLIVGSFGNSMVYRAPLKQLGQCPSFDLNTPRSCCPHCASPIAWYDNLPLVSWIALRGACRHCKTAIPVRYIALEAIGLVIGLCAGLLLGAQVSALAAIVASLFLVWAVTILIAHSFVPRTVWVGLGISSSLLGLTLALQL